MSGSIKITTKFQRIYIVSHIFEAKLHVGAGISVLCNVFGKSSIKDGYNKPKVDLK
jgi:hypothetical protein